MRRHHHGVRVDLFVRIDLGSFAARPPAGKSVRRKRNVRKRRRKRLAPSLERLDRGRETRGGLAGRCRFSRERAPGFGQRARGRRVRRRRVSAPEGRRGRAARPRSRRLRRSPQRGSARRGCRRPAPFSARGLVSTRSSRDQARARNPRGASPAPPAASRSLAPTRRRARRPRGIRGAGRACVRRTAERSTLV